MLAFSRGREWTGEYLMEFGDLMSSSAGDVEHIHEARFSFIRSGYTEEVQTHENEDQANEESLALMESSITAMNSINQQPNSILLNGSGRSGTDFFAAPSFKGLNMQYDDPFLPPYIIGRRGRAAGYDDEKKARK